jgi:voltage-dependent potassium channel beta subunit
MQYRKLGKWGVKVSEVALGNWLTYGGSVEEKNSIDQIKYAYDKGIVFFDSANVYAHGNGEIVMGKAVKGFRGDVVLATKVYFPMGDGPNDRGLSRKHVMEQCHASLKRLGTDYIDLYQCHRFDPEVPLEELVMTMDILTRQGKILYWGVSEWPAEQIQMVCDIARSMSAPPPVSNQPRYNMLQREIEKEVIPASWRNGMGQVVFSPLAQGVLSGKYKPGAEPPKDSRAASEHDGIFMRDRDTMSDATLAKVQQIIPIAAELGLTPAQLALAWCLRRQELSAVIIGATKPSQIDENIKASGTRLSNDVVTKIDNILEPQLSSLGGN